MLDNYLIIHKSILPEYYEKVVEAKRLLETGEVRDVSQAVQMTGISRSTFYKYKDFILEPAELADGRRAVISVTLNHENGVLSALLGKISELGGNILTITQSMPIRNLASVTVTVDISAIAGTPEAFLAALKMAPGVGSPRLIAVE